MSDGVTPEASTAEPPPRLLIEDRLRGKGLTPAPLIRRFAARSLDSLLKALIGLGITTPLWPVAFDRAQEQIDKAKASGRTTTVWLIDGATGVLLAELLAMALLVCFLYEVLPTAKWGRTIGKRLFGLTVVDIETLAHPSFRQATRRYLTRLALNLVIIGFFVGPLWPVVDRRLRQGWHDKAVHTCVVRDAPTPRRARRNHLWRLGGPLARWRDKPVAHRREQVRAMDVIARTDGPESRQPLDLLRLSDRPETSGAIGSLEAALERVFQTLGPPPQGLPQGNEPVVHGGGGNTQ